MVCKLIFSSLHWCPLTKDCTGPLVLVIDGGGGVGEGKWTDAEVK